MNSENDQRSDQDPIKDGAAKLNEGIDAARRTFHDARDAAGERVSEFTSKASEAVSEQSEAVKGQVSDALGAFAAAVRTAADELSKSDQGTAARFVQQAAGGLESLSGALGQKKLEDIVADIRTFGKSNPAAFMIGSVLAGVALGRFVRTSASHSASGDANVAQTARAANGHPDRPPSKPTDDTKSAERRPDEFGSPFTPSSFNGEI